MESDNIYFRTTRSFISGVYTSALNFLFRNFDVCHGEILSNIEFSEEIILILLGKGGNIALGVDYSKRIVYREDTDFGNTSLVQVLQMTTG